MKGRVTSDKITKLKPNQIFVFGSNTEGIHAGGAARIAMDKFGAVLGEAIGEFGQSYAIPTLDLADGVIVKGKLSTRKLQIEKIGKHVKEFAEHAKNNPDKVYLVTEIGCGIAGFKVEQIAPLFDCCKEIQNIHLPDRFWKNF